MGRGGEEKLERSRDITMVYIISSFQLTKMTCTLIINELFINECYNTCFVTPVITDQDCVYKNVHVTRAAVSVFFASIINILNRSLLQFLTSSHNHVKMAVPCM